MKKSPTLSTTKADFSGVTPTVQAAMLWADTLLALRGLPSKYVATHSDAQTQDMLTQLRKEAKDPHPNITYLNCRKSVWLNLAYDKITKWSEIALCDPLAINIICPYYRFCIQSDPRVYSTTGLAAFYVQPKGLRDTEGRWPNPFSQSFQVKSPVADVLEEMESVYSIGTSPATPYKKFSTPELALEAIVVRQIQLGLTFDFELQKEMEETFPENFYESLATRTKLMAAVPTLFADNEAQVLIKTLTDQKNDTPNTKRKLRL